ncbi:hypothetical protein OROMI_019304 [Orobanche minor]
MGRQNVKKREQMGSSSSGELKGKILVRVRRESCSVFYILDLDTGRVSANPHRLLDYGSLGTMVSLGSVVYVIGKPSVYEYGNSIPRERAEDAHNGASYLDLSKPQIGWKNAAPMFCDELSPDCVSLWGKLYAFRGSLWYCLGEVFNPKRNQRHRLLKPPVSGEFLVSPPVIADPLNNRILVHLQNNSSIYAYYPDADRWDCLVEAFGGWCRKMVCVDGVIYMHCSKLKGMVMAYDLASKQLLDVAVSSEFESPLTSRQFHSIFHRGNGLLCLVSCLRKNGPSGADDGHDVVHVVEFKAELKNNPKQVLVTPVSSKFYPLDSRCRVTQYLLI